MITHDSILEMISKIKPEFDKLNEELDAMYKEKKEMEALIVKTKAELDDKLTKFDEELSNSSRYFSSLDHILMNLKYLETETEGEKRKNANSS